MIRVEVTSEADVTRMVAAFTVLPELRDSDYVTWLSRELVAGPAMRRAWRKDGQPGEEPGGHRAGLPR